VKLVHLVGFIIKKFVTIHGHMDVKKEGKFNPRTDQELPEGERRYGCTLSLTSALGGYGSEKSMTASLSTGRNITKRSNLQV
jgi:hypothetical protein